MFAFFRPIIEGMGLRFSTKRIPRGLLNPLLTLWEHQNLCLGILPPPVSPHEFDKVTVTHYGSIRDAERNTSASGP